VLEQHIVGRHERAMLLLVPSLGEGGLDVADCPMDSFDVRCRSAGAGGSSRQPTRASTSSWAAERSTPLRRSRAGLPFDVIDCDAQLDRDVGPAPAVGRTCSSACD
jgi:hypothetical protein